MDATEPNKIRMSLDGIEDGLDDACYLLGKFRRKARELGWTEVNIDRVTQDAASGHMLDTLKSYIEPSEPEPLSWRTQFQRNRDYIEGCRAYTGDGEKHPAKWLLRGLKQAISVRRPGTSR